MVKKPTSQRWLLTPLFGICVFVVLYVIAASLYPGGSQTDKRAAGFSVLHNYWCDLFDPVAQNGMSNPSRPVALVAMIVLTASFGVLWYLLPRLFTDKNRRQKIIPYTGISSMAIAAFLFTPYHEAVINLAGPLGGIALTMAFLELYRAGKKRLFILGLICLVLSGGNYFIYETGFLLRILALTQKITFLLFFVWAGALNLDLYRQAVQPDEFKLVPDVG